MGAPLAATIDIHHPQERYRGGITLNSPHESGNDDLVARPTSNAFQPPREQDQSPQAPLRVLIVTESFLPQINGVTNSVCQVATYLRAQGHTVCIVAPTKPDVYTAAEVITVSGIDLPVYRQFRLGFSTARSLKRIAAEFGPDLVHFASPFIYGAGALRALRHLPTVALYQTNVAGYAERYGLRALASWCWLRTVRIHGRADLTLVPSEQSRIEFQQASLPSVKIWGRGVDLDLFHPDRGSPELHQKLGGDARLLIGYVGRLSREKELEQLAAIADLPGVQLVVVGDGPMRALLQECVPTALFLGVRHGVELAELYATFDIFINPCTTETFCQSAQEALASGTPVVGPDAGGMRERITPGVTGLTYPPGDAESMRRTVEAIRDDEALLRGLSANARARSHLRSWDDLGAELTAHYRSVIKHSAVVAGRSTPTA